jgi:hypothetical protein
MSMQVSSNVFVGFISSDLTVLKMDNDTGLKASKKTIYPLEYLMFNSLHSVLVQPFALILLITGCGYGFCFFN